MDPITGLYVGGAIFGNFLNRRRQKKEAARKAAIENARRKAEFEHRKKVQERKWYQTLSIWNNKSKVKHPLTATFAQQAFQRGQSQAQVTYNNVIEKVWQDNHGLMEKYLNKKLGTSETQGASKNRIKNLDYAALISKQFENAHISEKKAAQSYDTTVEGLHNSLISRLNQNDADVAFQPMQPIPVTFDAAGLQSTDSSASTYDYLSAGLAGLSTFMSLR